MVKIGKVNIRRERKGSDAIELRFTDISGAECVVVVEPNISNVFVMTEGGYPIRAYGRIQKTERDRIVFDKSVGLYASR